MPQCLFRRISGFLAQKGKNYNGIVMTGKKLNHHKSMAPLPWIAERAASCTGSETVLDLACGAGRHGRCFLEYECTVTFCDIDVSKVVDLREASSATVMEADLEAQPWPFGASVTFDLVVVANYLWRPTLNALFQLVRPGGELLYQTFGVGNGRFGKPSNPDFLLKEGELLRLSAPNFEQVDYFHGEVDHPKPAIIQRLHARRSNRPYTTVTGPV